MKKILMIYKRDENGNVLDDYIDEYKNYDKSKLICSLKIDGTACLIQNGKLYKRYDNKKNKTPEKDWIFCYKNDKHNIYWVPVDKNDKWHLEGWNNLQDKKDGTYELIGPKINENKHLLSKHMLIKHDSLIRESFLAIPDNKQEWIEAFEYLDEYASQSGDIDLAQVEGIVLWDVEKMEPMFKIRKKDLGVFFGNRFSDKFASLKLCNSKKR